MKKIGILILTIILLCGLSGCKNKENGSKGDNSEMESKVTNNVVIELTDGRKIYFELYPEIAPISVANFLKLVDEHYYDGVVFHRIIDGFMIQTGGYYLNGEGQLALKDQVPSIKGEFSANGVENNLLHTLGVVSMARATAMDSASSQFFICSADSPHLDGNYAAFGKVTDEESLKVVLEVSATPTVNIGYGLTDFPYPNIITIKTIRRA